MRVDLGFIGALIGAAATIVAAILVIYFTLVPKARRKRGQLLYQLKDNRHLQGEMNEFIHREQGMGLVYLDLDNFDELRKSNSKRSEEVLVNLAQIVFNVVGHRGHLFRCAGDEFGVLVSERPEAQVLELAEQIRVAIEFAGTSEDLAITASVGVGCAPRIPGYELYSRVYEAVYAAKLTGKNRVVTCPLSAKQKAIVSRAHARARS